MSTVDRCRADRLAAIGIRSRTVALVLLTVIACGPAAADERPVTLDLWPGAAPGEAGGIGEEHVLPPQAGRPVRRLTNVSQPTITVRQPAAARQTGTAVIVCPGGGYNILAMDLEGEEVAEWLNGLGVTAVLLKYRVPRREGRPKHEAPLQDLQRALSLVRSRAEEWRIDPSRIGVLGFSAGGHLAAAASTNFDRRLYAAVDETDEVGCRPDFSVLVYPAYLFEDGKPAEEIRVTAETPPAFLVHAWDDPISPENSLQYALALKRAGVPAELHVYAGGGHGFGLRPSDHPCSTWPARCEEWMKSRGLLTPAESR